MIQEHIDDHVFLKIQLLPYTMHKASLRGIIDTTIDVKASSLLEENIRKRFLEFRWATISRWDISKNSPEIVCGMWLYVYIFMWECIPNTFHSLYDSRASIWWLQWLPSSPGTPPMVIAEPCPIRSA